MNGMFYTVGIFAGIAAFVVLVVFEILKCRSALLKKKGSNPFFVIGVLLLLTGWVFICIESKMSTLPVFIVGAVVTCVGVVLYILVLLKTSGDDNYISDSGCGETLDKGAYEVVRHPGLWCFVLVSLGVGLMFPKTALGDVLFTVLNIIYIVLQDRVFFPVYLNGYKEYKLKVPFCFPKIRKNQGK